LYGALRKGVDDASGSFDDIQRNVRRVIQTGEEDGRKIGDWIAPGKPDVEAMIQKAVERVFKVLDLPRRTDVEALNENLMRVAEAIEKLDPRPAEAGTAPPVDEDESR
jgi:hypothetical protein